eukprot:GCRY01001196.1.p1 GENE.GCRY01001196.1~~GCRY01001196.1.p1  ORF type:complete len:491 (-),score=76.52 GCRY01001196.1:362-1834(-)
MSIETQVVTQITTFTETCDKDEGKIPWARLVSLNPENPNVNIFEDSLVIGRSPDSDVQFPNPQLSGKHTKIFRQARSMSAMQGSDNLYSFFVEDTSTNGTFLNGKKIGKGQKALIKKMDEISLVLKNHRAAKKKKGSAVPFYSYIFQPLTECEVSPDHPEVTKHYWIQEKIGNGNFAQVYFAIHKESGVEYALKIIDKKRFHMSNLRKDQLQDEVRALQSLHHEHIISIEDVFENEKHLYLVLELITGGDLFDRIVAKSRYSERDARLVFMQILSAVEYLHQQGYAHRDLKPENILLANRESDTEIKLSDFGLAKLITPESQLGTLCGTPGYLAPEVLSSQKTGKKYTIAVDLWSQGVILYALIAGYLPFDDAEGFTNVLEGKFDLEQEPWGKVSAEAKDLIRGLLTVDPEARLTSAGAWTHPWVADASIAENSTSASEDSSAEKPTENNEAEEPTALRTKVTEQKCPSARKRPRDEIPNDDESSRTPSH